VNKKIWLFLKLCISISLLIYAISIIDLEKLRQSISVLDFTILILAIIFGLLQVLINSMTQQVFFNILEEKLFFWKNYSHNLIGAFYGFLLPSTIGSDLYFTNYFSKEFASLKKALVGVVFIRLVGLLMFFVFFGFFAITIRTNLAGVFFKANYNKVIYIVSVIILIIVTLYFIFRKRLNSHFEDIFELTKQILSNKKGLSAVLFLILLWNLFSISGRIYFARSIGIDLNIFSIAFTILLVNFILMLPISLSGIGLREISYIGLLNLSGIPSEKAFLLSLIDFSVLISAVIAGGAILLIRTIKNAKN
jgi:uncharacterized membrane protein YbhN (UPF0104 family)